MRGIRKSLLQLVFSGAYMLRWNDKLRPVPLWELDKQGHKMILAWLLWHCNAEDLPQDERLALGLQVVEGGLFDYLYRLVITDIKPPVFYRIKANKEHYAQLTVHVLRELEPVVRPLGEDFWERMRSFFRNDGFGSKADRILKAAHLYASNWEFGLIKPLNAFDEEISGIGENFQRELHALRDLRGMPDLLAEQNALARFGAFCGQLRFQIRWTQTPRTPATSVLAHMFLVACYAYFCSLTVGACTSRRLNNFFCGLFHDLPELLTRDIISPVKRSVDSLPALIREYEEQELERRIFASLRADGFTALVERLQYFLGLETGSEFHQIIREPGGATRMIASFEEMQTRCNEDAFDPMDGGLVKACDLLAAFIEAHSSIRNGMVSPSLQEAAVRIRTELRNHSLYKIGFDTLLADFD
jgi:putative hydrolase of HD superfamily